MPFRHAIAFDIIAKPGQPLAGLGPLYVPGAADFLGSYPFCADQWRLPDNAPELRLEAALALFAELEYGAGGQVEAVNVRMAGPMLGGTVGEAGMKWSVRRIWGGHSRALPERLLILDGFAPGGVLDRVRLCAWVAPAGGDHWQAVAAPVRVAQAQKLFDQPTLDWLVFTLNSQADGGAFERLSTRLAQAGEPAHALIALGGLLEIPALRTGDRVGLAAWDENLLSAIEVAQWLASGTEEIPEGLSATRVNVA